MSLNIYLSGKIDAKDSHYGGEDNACAPWKVGPYATCGDAAPGANGFVRWVKQVDKSRCDDDSRAEEARKGVQAFGDLALGVSARQHGEVGCECGNEADDEDGGDASAEKPIIFIFSEGEVADYVCLVCCCEIDMARVEGNG